VSDDEEDEDDSEALELEELTLNEEELEVEEEDVGEKLDDELVEDEDVEDELLVELDVLLIGRVEDRVSLLLVREVELDTTVEVVVAEFAVEVVGGGN
jgi:hypothetical protein